MCNIACMNIGLAREIYGGTAWHIDSMSVSPLMALLENAKYDHSIKRSGMELDVRSGGLLIANLDSVIILNSGDSTMGMREYFSKISKSVAKNSIKNIIFYIDSGGGSSNAVKFAVDRIKELKERGIYTYALVKEGGICASAAYGIATACDEIYSEDIMCMIGSIGTMMQMDTKVPNRADDNNNMHIRVYATDSFRKNEEIENAVRGNFEVMINDVLNPVNTRFKNMIRENRPKVIEEQLVGKSYFAKDVVNTLIDGIIKLEDLISNINNKKMNEEQSREISSLQSDLSSMKENMKSLTEDVSNAKNELSRINSWLAYSDVDSDLVLRGINSGSELTERDRELFFFEKFKSEQSSDLESGSPEEVNVETTSNEDVDDSEDGVSEQEKMSNDIYAEYKRLNP